MIFYPAGITGLCLKAGDFGKLFLTESLLANIYLDDLDKELESRGLSFCRYADDLVIYVGSERSGQRMLASLTEWIAKHLKLRVNPNDHETAASPRKMKVFAIS